VRTQRRLSKSIKSVPRSTLPFFKTKAQHNNSFIRSSIWDSLITKDYSTDKSFQNITKVISYNKSYGIPFNATKNTFTDVRDLIHTCNNSLIIPQPSNEPLNCRYTLLRNHVALERVKSLLLSHPIKSADIILRVSVGV